MRTEIKIHSTKVSIPDTENTSRDENTSLDEFWNLWTSAVREKNKERKQLYGEREKTLIEYGNQCSMSNDLTELQKLLVVAKEFRDKIIGSEAWNEKELICSDNLGNELYLESFEVKRYEKREEQINYLIDTIETKIELLKPGSQSNQKKITKEFKEYLTGCNNPDQIISKLHEILKGKKGHNVARVIRALNEGEFINITEGDYKKLFESMENEFGDIGRYSGMKEYYSQNKMDKRKSMEEINATDKIIKYLKEN